MDTISVRRVPLGSAIEVNAAGDNPTSISNANFLPENFNAALQVMIDSVDFLVQLTIPPTPHRVEVIYTHLSGTNNSLSMIVARLQAHNRITDISLDEIYQQFFNHPVETSSLRDASRRLGETVSDVAKCINTASDSTQQYGAVLTDFASSASKVHSDDLSSAASVVLDKTIFMTKLNRSLSEKLQASAQEIANLRDNLNRLEQEASIDSLTGILNRRSFDEALRLAIEKCSMESIPLSLIMIDIDHFKVFNDTHGHQIGDQVLRLVARIMSDCIVEKGTAARYGGEEFGVILTGIALNDALTIGDEIRRFVSAKKVVNRRSGADMGKITLSAGVAQLRGHEDADELVDRADEALYLAKKLGRDRVTSEIDVVAIKQPKSE